MPTLAKSTWSILRPFENNPYLELIVHRPKEVPSDKKSPLIVVPHGGPHDVYVVSLSLTISTLVSLGYFVVAGGLEIEEVQAKK
ncbi:18513_t:CDS:2 [Gigaspora rosea]|nr:18513_t:CDS:2 [Gigaspora rosea]